MHISAMVGSRTHCRLDAMPGEQGKSAVSVRSVVRGIVLSANERMQNENTKMNVESQPSDKCESK